MVPVDDVPPRSESCGLNLDIPSAFNQTMVEVRSQNEDGPGDCSQTTGELSMGDGRFRAKSTEICQMGMMSLRPQWARAITDLGDVADGVGRGGSS